MGRDPKPAKAKVEAKLPPARTSRKRKGSTVHDLEKRLAESLEREKATGRVLTEALEQQTATAEILRAINSSPTDLQPVLDTLAESAGRLCGADDVTVWRVDGELLRVAAHHGSIPTPVGEHFIPLTRGLVTSRSVLERHTIHVADLQAETAEFPGGSAAARRFGHRTILSVPLLREDIAIGAIALRRNEVQLFNQRQIGLLQTFADQAVIAIENVRLFNETKEALERQTATSEILRVVSRSQTDVQPVFDTIADNAVSLFRPWSVAVYRFDGEYVHVAAVRGGLSGSEEYLRAQGPRRPTRNFMVGRCVIQCSVVHIRDFENEYDLPAAAREIARLRGFKASLSVPMLKDGQPIGAISVSRAEAGAFSQTEIQLLQTFADQAVIAIENVRLFTELETRNRQLTESLDQQTATSEVLRVISSSPTEVQPVFEAIARSAMRLLNGATAGVQLVIGDELHFGASVSAARPTAEQLSPLTFPIKISEFVRRRPILGQVLQTRSPASIADIETDPRTTEEARQLARTVGFRSNAVVPMLRDGHLVGIIAVTRTEPHITTAEEIALLQTFAAQAVIAIENVRLFTELKEKNQALTVAHAQVTEALDQQTATSEVLKVISRSTFDLDPVLQTLVENAARLCGAQAGLIYRVEDGVFRVAAHYATSPEILAVAARVPIHADRGSATGRATLERRTVHIPDVLADPEYRNEQQQQIGIARSWLFPCRERRRSSESSRYGKLVSNRLPTSRSSWSRALPTRQ